MPLTRTLLILAATAAASSAAAQSPGLMGLAANAIAPPTPQSALMGMAARQAGPSLPSLAALPGQGGRGQLLGGVVGCDASGYKQGVGALAGGAVGGLAGDKLLKSNKTVGALAGAGAGAAAGSWVGCKMQTADRAHAQQAADARARAAAPPAYAPAPAYADAPAPRGSPAGSRADAGAWDSLRFGPGVMPASDYSTAAAGEYMADKLVNLRAEPNTASPVLASARDRMTVIASVPDGPWLLVGHDGVADGYVSSTYLRRVGGGVREGSVACRPVHTATGDGRVQEMQACPTVDGGWTVSRR